MNEIKMYNVKFITYVDDKIYDKKESKCICIPSGGLIIREDEIDYYKQFGDGFASLTYIGSMLDRR